MSEERPATCELCGAPVVWCTCVQPDDCQVCGRPPSVTVYPNGRTVISCYHIGPPSRVIAGVNYEVAVIGWNQDCGPTHEDLNATEE
jgi:hypothetical protein